MTRTFKLRNGVDPRAVLRLVAKASQTVADCRLNGMPCGTYVLSNARIRGRFLTILWLRQPKQAAKTPRVDLRKLYKSRNHLALIRKLRAMCG